jgi:hypothetical protein
MKRQTLRLLREIETQIIELRACFDFQRAREIRRESAPGVSFVVFRELDNIIGFRPETFLRCSRVLLGSLFLGQEFKASRRERLCLPRSYL